jgi:hypothetical protein
MTPVANVSGPPLAAAESFLLHWQMVMVDFQYISTSKL